MAKSKSKLGDTRLERVHGMLIYAMSQKMSVVLRQLSKDRTEGTAFGRFINNPKVQPENIIKQYHHVSPMDFRDKHILIVEDSSSAAFGLHANRKDLGYIGPNTTKSGFDLHPAIYMDAQDGACYGLGGLKIWKTGFTNTSEEKAAKLKRRKGQEKPVHWRILTSHPVQTPEQAKTIVQWYRWRWVIEQVFRTLKTEGLNIEKSEVESYEGLVNLATLALLAAVQVLQLVQARDGQTNQEAATVFSNKELECLEALNQKLEGKTEKTKNPYPITSLAFVTWIIARLGGWKGYKKSRPPGPITMLRGIVRFYDILEGYYLLL